MSVLSRVSLCAAALLLASPFAMGDEAAIRKNLGERAPEFAKIDEVTKTPIPGIYEVRVGTEVAYTDEQGNYLIQGSLINTRTGVNITEQRVNKLNAIDFASLPVKDAIVWKNGNGKRKLAIFADPNCGYCKHFERTLQGVKDITVYTFVIPILGGDSPEKSKAIWCQKDNTSAWRSWMLDGKMPFRLMGTCDTSAIDRNLAFSVKHRVTGTPALVFEDGTRVPGALPLDKLEKQLAQSSKG